MNKISKPVIEILHKIGIAFFVLIAGFPFYWMLIASFRHMQEVLTDPGRIWVTLSEISFSAYYEVLFEHNFIYYITNSLYVSTITVFLTISLAVLGAYAATRFVFRGKNVITKGILLIYMFPSIVLVIPLYVIFSRLGIRNSLNGLIIVYLAQTLPVSIYMLQSYFKSIPASIEEQGMIDGCNRLQVITKITLPLSLPAISTVALYAFMIAWNEFLFAYMFLDDVSQFTLTRGVVQVARSIHLSQQLTMAGAVITSIPIILLFLLAERYITEGLTTGGVKE